MVNVSKNSLFFGMHSARNSAAAEIRLRPKVSAEIRPKLSALPKFGRTLILPNKPTTGTNH